MKNLGNKNEYDFIRKINNKKIKDLDFLLQELILFLFPGIKNTERIYCYKNVEYEKPDICIKVNNKIKYISIKMGHKNSVHCESIKKFILFLKDIGVNHEIVTEILRYQYADGTINNTGNHRQSSIEYKEAHVDSICNINLKLKNEAIIEKAVNRFIIQGTQYHSHKIDLLIYGTPEYFFFITPLEILNFVKSKKNIESSAIHFSCLTFQPLSRSLDYNPKMEYMRNWIQIKWYNLEDNIIEIMNERVSK